jgi:hypothetical protein
METSLLYQNFHGQWKIIKEVPQGTVVTSEDQVYETADEQLATECQSVVDDILENYPDLKGFPISSVHITLSDVEPPRGIINIEVEKETPYTQIRFFEGLTF